MPEENEKETTTPAPAKTEEPRVESLSKHEVEALLAKARQEEKDKLYPQLEELRSTTKEVQDALRLEREEKERIRREAESQAEEERKSQLSAEQLLQEGLQKIEEQLASERQARAALEERIQQDKRKEQLAAYRVQKIKEANGQIIPEIVQGSSETEIDANTLIAKARYVELVESLKEARAEEVRGQMPRPASPDTEPQELAELNKQLDNFEIDMVRYKRDKTYRAEMDTKKSALMDDIARAYAKSVGA